VTTPDDLAGRLIAWYDAHRRDLPWRRTSDPYRIWLSEVMLQQTRVETVIPYYKEFLEHFPTVEALAAAGVDEVLACWSGLGYYRRARQLHRAARQVVEGGGMPRTAEGLRELAGIGPYTAAAVASIAFGVPAGVLDGNVERVVTRLTADESNPRTAAGKRRLREVVEETLLDRQRPGDSNQALMELGATVCLPRRPYCLLCPLVDHCAAAAGGDQEAYPVLPEKKASRRVLRVMAMVFDGPAVLLYRRPDDSELLAGMWEIPFADAPMSEGSASAPESSISISEGFADDAAVESALLERYGDRFRLGPLLGETRHGITTRSFRVRVHAAELVTDGVAERGEAARERGLVPAFHGPGALAELPLSSLVTKALAVAQDASPDRPTG
jgi:A/G-specific adenine glycosylase